MAASQKTSPLLIAAAWALVVIPTAWGLNFTVKNALKIFTSPASSTGPAAVAPVPSTSR